VAIERTVLSLMVSLDAQAALTEKSVQEQGGPTTTNSPPPTNTIPLPC